MSDQNDRTDHPINHTANQPTATRPAAAGVHLKEIGQIALTVRDLERAKDFYGRVLALEFLFDAGDMAFFSAAEMFG